MVDVLLNSAVGTLSWCVNISNTTLYTLNILPKKVLINFPWMSLKKKKKGKQNYYLIQPWVFISHCGRTGILWISEKGRLFLQSRSKPCPLLEGLSAKRIFFNWSIAISHNWPNSLNNKTSMSESIFAIRKQGAWHGGGSWEETGKGPGILILDEAWHLSYPASLDWLQPPLLQ